MLEMKPEKYGKYKGMLNKEMDEVMQQAIKAHPKYKEICDAIRNEALVACISQSYSEYMWKNYAEDSEGICLVYNLRQLLLKKPDKLIIYPVRYVDVKPIAIIMGKNIDRNPAFKQKVIDYSKDCNVKLLQEGQNSFDANK